MRRCLGIDTTAESNSCIRFCLDDDTSVFSPSTTISPTFVDLFLLDVILKVRDDTPLSETTVLLESGRTTRELALVGIFDIVEVGPFPTLGCFSALLFVRFGRAERSAEALGAETLGRCLQSRCGCTRRLTGFLEETVIVCCDCGELE